jgi:branched-chain amino acid aminotransferase
MRAWVNGRLLDDPGEPALPVSDHGFTVGDGVFETMKVVDGRPFALTRHLDRLATSAVGLGLPEPDPHTVRTGVAAVLEAQDLPLGRLRITYTGGPAPMGSGRGDAPPTLVVVADAMQPWGGSTAVVTVPWPRNERGAIAGLKTTSYAENVVALAAAREYGASEAIFANTAGDLCEGTGSNVFYVLDGELRTPTLASGCLAGISRALLLEWYGAAPLAGVPLREVDEPVEVLTRAEEIFLVSTTRDVQAVHQCNGRNLFAPGPVTASCQELWAQREAADSDP